MSNIDKQAVQLVADLKAGYTLGHADVEIIQQMALDAVTLMGKLEAKDKRLNEIITPNMLLPVIDDMDADNLRHVIKTVCENYSLLHAKWEASENRAEVAEKRIAELEAPAPELKMAHLINKFYERYPLAEFKSDTERSAALGYYMAGAELQCFGEFINYAELMGDE